MSAALQPLHGPPTACAAVLWTRDVPRGVGAPGVVSGVHEDLIQQVMEGLVHAAQKYSPKEVVNFAQYAQLRIRGSIIDLLRKNSNLCRTTIKKKTRV